MPIHNSDIADIFDKIADLLEIQAANPFRVRAYRRASLTVKDYSRPITQMIKAGENLTELPGIGKDLAAKIYEIVDTGDLAYLKELEKEVPEELSSLMNVAGLGPKRVHVIHEKLGVTNLDDLRLAIEEGKIKDLPGFGAKTEKNIRHELERLEKGGKRILLVKAEQIAASLVAYLKNVEGIGQVTVAGSFRRCKETVGDLDILVTADKDAKVMDAFVQYEDTHKVISQGKTRSTIELKSGLHVDLRLVEEDSYGAALHYFTGSKAHNIAVRKMGIQKGYKINEYGVFKNDKSIAGRTEEEVYASVGLPYFEPELREDRGEFEAAAKNRLPNLLTFKDIHGDLHMHTNETDGRSSLEEMVEAARQKRYEYIAITNHTKHVTMAQGLDAKRLAQEIKAIDKLNEKLTDLVILKAAEMDILKDGSLDLPDEILKELDFAIISVHYNMTLNRDQQTERILRAMDSPYATILGHPTGRLLLDREPYEVDMPRIIEAAAQRGCFLELNAHPDRLDLNDIHCKMAKEAGVKVCISSDAHHASHLDFLRFGVAQARRGWLETDDVINTRPLSELCKLLGQRR